MIQGLLLGRSCLDSYGFTAIMINRTINQASQAPEIYYSSCYRLERLHILSVLFLIRKITQL